MKGKEEKGNQGGGGLASELTGGCCVSLDGRSLNIPSSGMNDSDDISSINSDYYQSIRAAQLANQYNQQQQRNNNGDDFEISSFDYENPSSSPSSPFRLQRQEISQLTTGSPNYNLNYQNKHSFENRHQNYDSRYSTTSAPGGGGNNNNNDNTTTTGMNKKNNDSSGDSSTSSYDSSYEYGYGYSRKSDNSRFGCCCLPIWITEAPFWLKMVIVISAALLVGAIVLVGVGTSLAIKHRAERVGGSGGGEGTVITGDGDDSTNIYWPEDDTYIDGSSPTSSPLIITTDSPTTKTSPWNPKHYNSNTTLSFFVTGGRFQGDDLDELPDWLSTLPNNVDGTSVLFHLGDWNSPYQTSCVENSYKENSKLYKDSSLPVYFIVGDNEFNGTFLHFFFLKYEITNSLFYSLFLSFSYTFNVFFVFILLLYNIDCPDPEKAYNLWYKYLLDYETSNWPEPTKWTVERQDESYKENFAYIYKNVLILAINLVGGEVHNNEEWSNRHNADLQWIDLNYNKYQGQFDTMVLLAHADPEIEVNKFFFDEFFDQVQNEYTDTQVLFIHRNLNMDTWGLEPKYNNINNLMTIIVEGAVWPPMMVSIDTTKGTVDIDQDQWYEDYIESLEQN